MQFSPASFVAFMALAGLGEASWGVSLFRDANFQGGRVDVVGELNQCSNVPGIVNDRTSSVTGSTRYGCDYYANAGCNTFVLHTAPNQDFPVIPRASNDRISSVRCRQSKITTKPPVKVATMM